MMTTLEYATIRKCLSQLKSELSLDLSIADDLLADDFISEPASKKMRLIGVDDHTKAGELIDNILHQIKMKQERYHEFITILRKEPSRESMVELLEKTYEEEKQHRKYSHRSSSFGYDATEADCSSRRHSCPVIPGAWPRHRSHNSSSSSSKGPDDVFSPTHPHKNGGSNDNELNAPNVLSVIADVSNWRNLGTQLGIESSKLDEIDRCPVEEQKTKMVTTWLNCDENPSWDKLYRALRRPSVNMNRAADKVASRFRGSSFNESLDTMDSIDETSSTHSKEVAGDQVIPFTEATVLDAVVKISNICELGQRLGIPDNLINDIEKYPIDERKQRLVSTLFQVKPENCNWDKVNAAIHEVAMYEWTATRRSSLTKSSSLESVSVLSSISIGAGGSANQKDTSLPATLENINTDTIKASYSKLLRNVERKLKGMDLNMEEFHSHIKIIFAPEDLSRIINDDFNVQKIFKALTDHHLWKFESISKLQKIVEFIEDDESLQLLQELIRKYKFELNGYLANTKIIDRIRSDEIKEKDFEEEEYESIKSNKKKYDKAYRKKLSVALFKGEHGRNLTMESLMYIDKVWNELCDEFDISLSSVLDSIRENCIEITWLIPSVSAQQILKRLEGAVEFFKRKFISCVMLEGILIYSESAGIVGQKILDQTQLLLAVQDGSLERMKSVLETYNGDVDAQLTKTGRTALMFAAQHDHRVLFEFLRNQGADMYLLDNDGMSIISLSETHKDLHNKIVDTFEEKLFTVAKEGGDLSLLEKLFKIGVNINALEKDEFQWTPLLWACENGHEDVVDYLLEHNADPNAQDKKNWTGLILASRNGYAGIVRRLLDKGADVNKETDSKWTSLQWTAQEGHTEVARMLLDKGARTEVEDEDGYSPLLQASQDGHLEIVKLLFEYNPEMDPDKPTPDDWSALLMAAKNGHEAIMQFLVDHGADVNHKKEEDGVTALHVSSYNGRNNIVRNLCLKQKEKIDVNIQDDFGNTPLIFAAKQKKLDVVKTLVGNGHADVNVAEEKTNWTALFFAVQNNGQEIVEYLLETQKVDLKHKDKEGNTVIDVAKEINPEALEYLSKHFPAETEEVLSKKTSITMTMKQGKATYYWTDMINNMDLRMTAPPKRGMAAAA